MSKIKGHIEISRTCTKYEIEDFRANCPKELPIEYIDFICENHYVTGDLPNMPFYFRLWKPSEILGKNIDYEVKDNIPEYFAIGDEGGGEMFTISYANGKIYLIPFVPMSEENGLLCFDSFNDFIENMGWKEEQKPLHFWL